MKSEKDIIKLSKEEVNELLYHISKDNKRNALIFKIMYIYAKAISDVLRLKKMDVDLEHDGLVFNLDDKSHRFVLHGDVKDDLMEYINGQWDYLFIDEDKTYVTSDDLNIYRVKLNQYLSNFIKKLNENNVLGWECPNLFCTDFKILRGQHLFVDGVDIHLIHELYGYKHISNTKNVIKYKDLGVVRFPCDSLDCVFSDFTDLNLYRDRDFDGVDVLTVYGSDGGSIVLECDYALRELNILGGESDSIVDVLLGYDTDFLFDLFGGIGVGCYKFVDGLKVFKN